MGICNIFTVFSLPNSNGVQSFNLAFPVHLHQPFLSIQQTTLLATFVLSLFTSCHHQGGIYCTFEGFSGHITVFENKADCTLQPPLLLMFPMGTSLKWYVVQGTDHGKTVLKTKITVIIISSISVMPSVSINNCRSWAEFVKKIRLQFIVDKAKQYQTHLILY